MAEDDYLPDHERRLLRRRRRKTQRATLEMERPESGEHPLELDSERPQRTTGTMRSFRNRALAEYTTDLAIAPALRALLEEVMSGKRDAPLALALGTDTTGLRELERRFETQAGRSVYVAAVQVANRAARLRFEALG